MLKFCLHNTVNQILSQFLFYININFWLCCIRIIDNTTLFSAVFYTDKYGANMKLRGRMPDALAGAMGNQMYIVTLDTQEEVESFFRDLLEEIG